MPLWPRGVGVAEYARDPVYVDPPTPAATDDRVAGDDARLLPALPLAPTRSVAGQMAPPALPTVPFNLEAR